MGRFARDCDGARRQVIDRRVSEAPPLSSVNFFRFG